MILIITGTIKPVSQDVLFLLDEKERLNQYVESIKFNIDAGAFDRIIFCENSNYEGGSCQELTELKNKAKEKNVSLEVLQFEGDSEGVKRYGKGYGEGQIMKYIFDHSSIIKDADDDEMLVKITGRLIVNNINKIARSLNKKKCFINIPNKTRRDIFDTRIFAMPLGMYKAYFMDAYLDVRDSEGIFYEHVYTRIIKENNLPHVNFPSYPRITGVSGSNGNQYVYTEWKCRLKDIQSKFNYYGSVK